MIEFLKAIPAWVPILFFFGLVLIYAAIGSRSRLRPWRMREGLFRKLRTQREPPSRSSIAGEPPIPFYVDIEPRRPVRVVRVLSTRDADNVLQVVRRIFRSNKGK
jgi:hypothetical protein